MRRLVITSCKQCNRDCTVKTRVWFDLQNILPVSFFSENCPSFCLPFYKGMCFTDKETEAPRVFELPYPGHIQVSHRSRPGASISPQLSFSYGAVFPLTAFPESWTAICCFTKVPKVQLKLTPSTCSTTSLLKWRAPTSSICTLRDPIPASVNWTSKGSLTQA